MNCRVQLVRESQQTVYPLGYVQAISYSATILFHMIPAVTETSTRLPPSAPWVASPDAPALQAVQLVLLVAFLVGLTLQIRSLRASPRP